MISFKCKRGWLTRGQGGHFHCLYSLVSPKCLILLLLYQNRVAKVVESFVDSWQMNGVEDGLRDFLNKPFYVVANLAAPLATSIGWQYDCWGSSRGP